MAVHERPKVLLFTPYAATARINGTRYISTLPLIDVGYTIADLNGVIQQQDVSPLTGPDFTVTGLTLNVGETYTARLQYNNASGSSVWSRVLASTVFSSGFDLTPLAIPALPGETGTPIPLAIAPSYRVELENRRGIITHKSQAGHDTRRITSAAGTVRVRLSWFGLDLAQRDTILQVLEDSLGSYDAPGDVRGFDFSTVAPDTPQALAGTSFLPVRGTIIHRQTTAGVYEVTIDAMEVLP